MASDLQGYPRGREVSTSYLSTSLYNSLSHAYSLRRLASTYIGPCIAIRRSSDSTTRRIGFTASGDLDTDAIRDFVGPGSGFVATWYDQFAASDVTQGTASAQPLIWQNGRLVTGSFGVKPTIRFDGIDDRLSNSFGTVAQPYTYSIVVNYYNGVVKVAGNVSQSPNVQILAADSTTPGMYAGTATVNIASGINSGQRGIILALFNGASSVGAFNGAEVTGNPGTSSANGIVMASDGGGVPTTNYGAVDISEFLILNSAASATTRYQLFVEQSAYWPI